MERILNRNPRIVIPPETGFFRFLDMLGLLNVDSPSREELLNVVRAYEREKRFPYLGLDEAEAESELLKNASSYADIFVNLMERFRRTEGKERWGEKTPSHLLYVDSIRECFPNALFILVVRDGRAVIASQLKHPVWNWDLLQATRRWSRDAKVMMRIMARLNKDRLFVVRFEELVQDPEKVTRAMCKFLGEEFDQEMIRPSRSSTETQSQKDQYYGRSWMQKSRGAIDNTRANDWHKEYSAPELKLVEKMIGSELKKLGYALENPAAPAWPILYLYQEVKTIPKRIWNRLHRRGKFPMEERV